MGLLKAKLARYRAQLIEPTSKSGPKVSIVLLIAYDGISHVLPPCYPLCKIVQFHFDVVLTREGVYSVKKMSFAFIFVKSCFLL